jgi:hypothetical protein
MYKNRYIAFVCRSKTSKEVKPGSTFKQGQADGGNIQNISLYDSKNDNINSDELGIYSLYSVGSENLSRDRYSVELSLNGVVCDMEIDTAADFSIMSKSIYDQNFSHFPLYPSAINIEDLHG